VTRNNGFTLIELLLTIVVITAGLLGIMSLFENATRGAVLADVNVIAVDLAHEKLERIVLDKWKNGYVALNQTLYPDETFTGDYSIFTRQTQVSEVANTDFTTLSVGSGYKRVDVTVKWGTTASQRITVPTVLANY